MTYRISKSLRFALSYASIVLISAILIKKSFLLTGMILGTLALPLYVLAMVSGCKRKFSPYMFWPSELKKLIVANVNPVIYIAAAPFMGFMVELIFVAETIDWSAWRGNPPAVTAAIAGACHFIAHLVVSVRLNTLKMPE